MRVDQRTVEDRAYESMGCLATTRFLFKAGLVLLATYGAFSHRDEIKERIEAYRNHEVPAYTWRLP